MPQHVIKPSLEVVVRIVFPTHVMHVLPYQGPGLELGSEFRLGARKWQQISSNTKGVSVEGVEAA